MTSGAVLTYIISTIPDYNPNCLHCKELIYRRALGMS